MSRRRSLPGADELFRSTGGGAGAAAAAPAALARADQVLAEADEAIATTPSNSDVEHESTASPRSRPRRRSPRTAGERRPSGRERHDEKITVYVSAEELLDLEHARLALRGEHGLAVDRGRIVREALAYVLADLDAKGDASILVRRVRGR